MKSVFCTLPYTVVGLKTFICGAFDYYWILVAFDCRLLHLFSQCCYTIVNMRGRASAINPFHFDHQAIVLEAESCCLPQDPVTGCMLLDSTSKGYARWRFMNLVTGKKEEHYVHRIYFACKNLVMLESNQTLHVSHRCHTRKCLAHLSYEPAYLNRDRVECLKIKRCSGHDSYAACHLL